MSASRFPLATLEPADDLRVRTLWGRPPINLYRILAHQPAILRAWTEWNDALRQGCGLPRALRELIFLRSARLHQSDYEWSHHLVMARKAGLDESKIQAVSAWDTAALYDERERAALAGTDEITKGELTDATFTTLRAVFSPAQTIEVIVTASHACMLARIIQAIGVTTAGENPDREPQEQES